MSNKDSTKTWYVVLLCCAVLCFPFGYFVGLSQAEPVEPEPPLPSLIDIQRLINVEPDGIYGPVTDLAWRQAFANQEAAEFMTASGAPREK